MNIITKQFFACHSRVGGNPVKRHGRDKGYFAPQMRRLDTRFRGYDK